MVHELDEMTLVAGQIAPADVAALKAQGVTMIVNNRPDGEDVGQPTSAEIEAAARDAGLDYRHVPIARGMGPVRCRGDARRDARRRQGRRKVVRLLPHGQSLGAGVGGGEERGRHRAAKTSNAASARLASTSARSSHLLRRLRDDR